MLPHFGDKCYWQKVLSDLSRPVLLRRHFSNAASSSSPSGQNLFGAESQQKLLFVPDADNTPEARREISDPALFRFLLNEESLKQLDTTQADEIPDMLKFLKDVDKESKITEFEIHRSSMGSAKDSSMAFHVFMVFKSTSETDGDYWWSLEKNTKYIVLQRCRNKENVKDKLEGKQRKKVEPPIVENLAGIGTIKDLFALLWAQQMILEKYHIVNSNCQSLVTFVSREITETRYEYKGDLSMVSAILSYIQPSKITENDQKAEMLNLINILRVVVDSSWHPLFILVILENTHLFDDITKGGQYNMGITQYGLTLLDIAILFSTPKMVEHLLKHPVNADSTTHNGYGMNALDMAAMFTKETKIIDLLLEQDKAKKCHDDGIDKHGYGPTALHYAAITSNEITAEHLIKKQRADLHCRDQFGNTPLHMAALFAKDMKVIDVLLRNMNEGDVEQYRKDTILLPYAMHNDHEMGEDIFERLVAKGIANNEDLKALKAAKERRSNCNKLGGKMVSLMEQRGAVLEERIDEVSKQPNRQHTQSNYEKIRETNTFKAHFDGIAHTIGDNANKKGKFGWVLKMALTNAIADSDVERARRLFKDFGANIATLTWGEEKYNALHLTSHYAKTTELLDAILATGQFDINGRDEDGSTALHLALRSQNVTSIRYLLEKGADPTIQENDGMTPFHQAAALSRDPDILKLFLENNQKFDIDHRNKFKMTALHMATVKSNTAAARFLLSKGADPNAVDPNGYTPLHFAVSCAKDMDIIKLLLNHKDTNIYLLDHMKRKALDYAMDNEHGLGQEIANLLEEKMAGRWSRTTDGLTEYGGN